MSEADTSLLSDLYYDLKNPASYGTLSKLFSEARKRDKSITRKGVENWLQTQEAYTLHRPIRKRYLRRKVIARGIDDQWQLDLMFLDKLARYNRGNKYLLVGIDVFSRRAFARALKRKTGKAVADALATVLKKKVPRLVQTDAGGEFFSHQVQKLLKKHGVKLFSTAQDTKASVIERFIRTLRGLLYRYFTKNSTKKYVDVLEDLIGHYNNSVHRSLGIRPADVGSANERTIWNKLYASEFPRKAIFKFQLGDVVRISKLLGRFEKSALPQWSREHFTITRRRATKPVTYGISDDKGNRLKGSFYDDELQKIRVPKDTYYKIEILRQRRRLGKKEYFVRYVGWPDNFSEWIRESQLQK